MQGIASLGPDSPFPLAAYTIIFGAGLALSLALTPLAGWIGRRFDLVAYPGGRRLHNRPIPRTGGIAVFAAFLLAVLLSQVFIISPFEPGASLTPGLNVFRFDPKEGIRLIGLLGGCLIIFVTGLIDDRVELSPLAVFAGQLLAGAWAILFWIIIEYVNNPFSGLQTPDFPYVFTVVITLFWLGLTTNTVNWLDGLDGLASGVVALACVVLFINGVIRLDPPQYSVAFLFIALLGAVLGFLPYNFSPARIFLGGGAYFLGYTLGVLSIIGGAKAASILLVLGLPLLDTGWQVVNRLMQGKNPVIGDRGHLHFRLQDLGLSQRGIVLGYYAFCAVFGGLSLLIPSQIYKFVALLVMGLLALVGFVILARWKGKEGDS
jgi:UDP-GlcNAc:undecaprenyl-phosphate GlcNAc-1-phosphate transferase